MYAFRKKKEYLNKSAKDMMAGIFLNVYMVALFSYITFRVKPALEKINYIFCFDILPFLNTAPHKQTCHDRSTNFKTTNFKKSYGCRVYSELTDFNYIKP